MSGSVRGNWYYPPATVPLSLLLRNQIRHQSRDIYLHTHTGPSRSEHSQCDGSREWAIQIISVSEYWFSVVCGRDYGRNELLCNLTGVVRIPFVQCLRPFSCQNRVLFRSGKFPFIQSAILKFRTLNKPE
jgi:hypothetical protein